MRSNSVKITCSAKLKDIQNNIGRGATLRVAATSSGLASGLKRTATRLSPGTISFSNSNLF